MQQPDKSNRGIKQSSILALLVPLFQPPTLPQQSHSRTLSSFQTLLSHPVGNILSLLPQLDQNLEQQQQKLQDKYTAGMKKIEDNNKTQQAKNSTEMEQIIAKARANIEDKITKKLAQKKAAVDELKTSLINKSQVMATEIIESKFSRGKDIDPKEIRQKLQIS